MGNEGQSVELWRNKMSRDMSFGVIDFEVQRNLVEEMGCVECGVDRFFEGLHASVKMATKK